MTAALYRPVLRLVWKYMYSNYKIIYFNDCFSVFHEGLVRNYLGEEGWVVESRGGGS